MGHLAVEQGKKPDVAEIHSSVVRNAPVMAGGFDDELAAYFAHTNVAERSETDELRKLTHVGSDYIQSSELAGSTLRRERQFMNSIRRIDCHPAMMFPTEATRRHSQTNQANLLLSTFWFSARV